MSETETRLAIYKKAPFVIPVRYQGKAVVAKFRYLLSVLLVTATSLVVSSAQAQWQAHQIKVGDGEGGQDTVSAQAQTLIYPGSTATEPTLPFGMVQMDNGEIAMTGLSRLSDFDPILNTITFSSDGGATWSGWQEIPAAVAPLSYLGGGKLSTADNFNRQFSTDYGRNWVSITEQPDTNGYPFGNFGREGTEAVDRDAYGNAIKITSLGFIYEPEHGSFPAGDASGRVRSSTDDGMTWQNEVTPPQWKFEVEYEGKTYTRGVSEGSIVRAANGDLVAALRTDLRPAYYPLSNDNFEGLAISISKDDGQTWSELSHLFSAGRHHANLQRMPNGALVMTMIVRDDIRGDDPIGNTLNGTSADLTTTKIGMDAMISYDNGVTWDLERRITLDEFENPRDFPNTVVGKVAATVLDDGSMISAYGRINKDDPGGASPLPAGTRLIKWDPTTTFGPRVELHINRFSGLTRMVGINGSIDMDSYLIANVAEGKVWIPGNWSSFSDKDGGTWEEVPPASPLTEQQALTELNFTGSKLISAGEVISLGNIYDIHDNDEDIKFNYGVAGSDATRVGLVVFEGDGLHLRVNKTTGKVRIVNVEAVDLDVDGYTIQTASGDLNVSTWNSLEDQAETGWEETFSNSNAISELNLTSSSILTPGGAFELGLAYQGGLGGVEDMTFNFSLSGGDIYEGVVDYIEGTGDFNGDNVVDGRDFLYWQWKLGDAESLALWEDNYGNTLTLSAVTGAEASTAAVPEPSSVVLLALGGFARLARRGWRSVSSVI